MGIKKMREAAGMTRTDLARLMGVTRQSVIQWEEGIAYPTAANLLRLADLFHCTTDELLGRNLPQAGESA